MNVASLHPMLRSIAATPVLLVASDFDGTLSPIVPRPADAYADARGWAAFLELARLPHTHAAVITGRSRREVIARLPGALEAGVVVVGCHGLEHANDELRLSIEAAQLLQRIEDLLHAETLELPGSLVESKPASATFHVRMAEPVAGEAALARLCRYGHHMPGVFVVPGKMAVELCVLDPCKGRALNLLRFSCGAGAAMFIGDDTTDEAGFGVLRPTDAAIKIGSGPTVAPLRVNSQEDVAPVFEQLLAFRREWLSRRSLVPIERHSLLSDQRAVALVNDRGSIVWGCMPRIDSPPIFADLLADGQSNGGEFAIEPAIGSGEAGSPQPGPVQRYDNDTFILETMWPVGANGSRPLCVTDYFDCSGGRPFQRAGRSELVRVLEGSGVARVRFAPRLDFGRVATTMLVLPDGLEVEGWHDPIVLRAPGVEWRIVPEGPHHTAVADIDLSRGPVTLEFRYGTASRRDAALPEAARREQSRRAWAGWASSLRVPDVHASLVRRSALVIKALCHGPTGAIAAAATTSLPEHFGGVRNWDYRYCWVRDACMAASSLVRLGNTGVGLRLLDWLVSLIEGLDAPERLRPLYTVTGDVLGPEAEIGELAGYGGSRPVRVSNAASHQVQLDVFGPVVELVALLAEAGAPVTPEQWRLVEAMVRAVELRWREADHGIWEIRGPKRHHVHTKAMCWLAVDRALLVAEHAMGKERPAWVALRQEILDDVLVHGVHEAGGGFTAAYGDPAADASALLVGLCGMVSPMDPRFKATVAAVERDLREGPVVARYRCDDGLPGREGGWLICATWLAESLALIGRTAEARELLREVAALAGPTGLMAEEFDTRHQIALGNFPQAYSHLGLINASVRLAAVSAADGLTETHAAPAT